MFTILPLIILGDEIKKRILKKKFSFCGLWHLIKEKKRENNSLNKKLAMAFVSILYCSVERKGLAVNSVFRAWSLWLLWFIAFKFHKKYWLYEEARNVFIDWKFLLQWLMTWLFYIFWDIWVWGWMVCDVWIGRI